MLHELKCWPSYFQQVACGSKPFELRHDDRPFTVGDELKLCEWDPDRNHYTGNAIIRCVTSVLRHMPGHPPTAGLVDGYVLLGLGAIPAPQSATPCGHPAVGEDAAQPRPQCAELQAALALTRQAALDWRNSAQVLQHILMKLVECPHHHDVGPEHAP